MNPCPKSFCSEPRNESRAWHDADVGDGDKEARAHWLGVLEMWTQRPGWWASEVDKKQRKLHACSLETPTPPLQASRSGPCQDLLPAGAEVCSATCSGRSLVGKAAHWLCFSPNTRLTPTFRHSAYRTKTRDTTQCQDTETRAENDHTLASC